MYKKLPIDPYTLGAWLGDGTSARALITTAHTDFWIIWKIMQAGITVHKIKHPSESTGSYYMNPAPQGGRGGMTTVLRSVGLINNKHIPEDYMKSSKANRLELLHGLMDTDGTADRRDKRAIFWNKNKRLAQDVAQLANSLGFDPAYYRYTRKSGPYKGYVYYNVRFRAIRGLNPFGLKRKADIARV